VTAKTERRGGWATWLLGLVDGTLLGVPGLVFGIRGVAVIVVIIVASAAVFRSLALLSGMLVGAGGLWAALLVRQAILICGEPTRAAGEACPPSGLAAFVGFAVGLIVLGAAVGAFARRRRPYTA
jgi:hypothetical protein